MTTPWLFFAGVALLFDCKRCAAFFLILAGIFG